MEIENMDLDKKYYDIDGDECNILDLVKCNPEWAVNRIQEGEKDLARDLELCMEPIRYECLCMNPPEDRGEDGDDPTMHSDYCPIYLYDYVSRIVTKK